MTDTDLSHQIFSNAWYRVADLRCALRPSVIARRQYFGSELWMVLNDKLSSEWFRVSSEAYQFLANLSLMRTVEEAWYATLDQFPLTTLSQEEVVQLLGQLHLSNMLLYDQAYQSGSFFERFTQKKRRENMSYLMGFLSLKIPLFDPDRFLNSARPFIRVLFGPLGILFYLTLVVAGIVVATQNADALFDGASGILAPDNLILLYVGFAVAKVIHELGHAALCKYYGGEVHVIGVMLLLFTPIPYVDASASWGLRGRGQRLWVAMAGMIFELGFASVALLVWANTAPGTLNALAYNIIFTASVSTLLFNSNPLLRFDGYHILVDILNIPNLYNNSRAQVRYLAQRYLLFIPNAQPTAQSKREAWILPIYGILSLGYWVVLMIGIVTFVAQQYLDLGILMAIVLVIMIFVVPVFKFLKYLFFGASLRGVRFRTVALVVGLAAAIIWPAFSIPVRNEVRVEGIVEVVGAQKIFSEASGQIVRSAPRNGSWITRQEPLMVLNNPELDHKIGAAKARLVQLQGQLRQAITQRQADMKPLLRQIKAMEGHIAVLESQKAALTLSADQSGYWSGQMDFAHLGAWVMRGTYVGIVTQPDQWRFVGVLPQVNTYVFDQTFTNASLKLDGQASTTVSLENPRVIPYDAGILPSAVLGMAAGGTIAVDPSDPEGLKTAEPFFRIEADLGDFDQVSLMHGAIATARLVLPDQPLGVQLRRKVEQFFQRRFRL